MRPERAEEENRGKEWGSERETTGNRLISLEKQAQRAPRLKATHPAVHLTEK